jgi:hypothetical protein
MAWFNLNNTEQISKEFCKIKCRISLSIKILKKNKKNNAN